MQGKKCKSFSQIKKKKQEEIFNWSRKTKDAVARFLKKHLIFQWLGSW